jgi:hypothetical protein
MGETLQMACVLVIFQHPPGKGMLCRLYKVTPQLTKLLYRKQESINPAIILPNTKKKPAKTAV